MTRKHRERIFRMKQFSVRHEISSNKVGVDGVLIGAWSPVEKTGLKILDVGCGCGLIALMLAQRCQDAEIIGIDIDDNAVKEAKENVESSPWSNRIIIKKRDFSSLCSEKPKFDLIVSNPPFFESGVDPSESARMLARHAGTLSPRTLLEKSSDLLTDSGILSLITLSEQYEELIEAANKNGLFPIRAVFVRGNPQKEAKRVMIAFRKPPVMPPSECRDMPEISPTLLTIEKAPGEYTAEYISLCREFYTIFD